MKALERDCVATKGNSVRKDGFLNLLSGSHYSSSLKTVIHFFQGRTFCQICYLNIDFRAFPWFESILPRLAKIQTISSCTLCYDLYRQVFSSTDKMGEDQNANCIKHTIPGNKMHWLQLLWSIFELLLKSFWLCTWRCLKSDISFLNRNIWRKKGRLRELYIKLVFLKYENFLANAADISYNTYIYTDTNFYSLMIKDLKKGSC